MSTIPPGAPPRASPDAGDREAPAPSIDHFFSSLAARNDLWRDLSRAARAWAHMRDAAWGDGVVLEAISGYRSHDYQLGIFERKLSRGLSVVEILTVNAAPGYS